MLSMFKEKDCDKVGTTCWSMTRVVAFLFTLTYCYVLISNSVNAHAIGWPFCVLGVVVLLAVPLQALFKYIQLMWNTSMGQKITKLLLDKLGGAVLSAPTTTTKVETSTGGGDVPSV